MQWCKGCVIFELYVSLKSNGCWFWIWNNLESGRNSSGWMRILIGSHTFCKTDSRVPKKTFHICMMNAVVPNFLFSLKSDGCWFWTWNNLESVRNSSEWMRILIGSHTFCKTDSRVPKKTFHIPCRMLLYPTFYLYPKVVGLLALI